jgi:phospho-N-acetylmuramoyl-pentapeptide-transferase
MFLGPKFISYLREKEFGQHIREEGPAGHHGKAGTPTMGGLIMLVAVAVPFLIILIDSGDDDVADALAVLGTMIAAGLLGFIDDWTKISKRRSLGVSGKRKLVAQALIAIGLWLVATELVGLDETIDFRLWDLQLDIGPFYPVLIFLVLAGATNGVNLTDGLDGLAAGCSAMVFGAYVVMSFWQFTHDCVAAVVDGCYQVRDPLDVTLVAAAAMGACLGFLWWNTSPARIFMGDTGSLALGGLMAGIAIVTRTELLLVVLGGLFVAVTLSVVIQVAFFRATRRRVFRMAPLHHHFELAGWTEQTVIVRFWLVTAMAVAFGLGLFYADWLRFAGL